MAQYTRTQTSQIKIPENSYHHSEMVTINPPILPKWVLILWICCPLMASANEYHQPFKWTLSRFGDQKIIATQITSGGPSFTSTLCQLVPRPRCWEYMGFYMCPSSNPGKGYCNSPNQYYCSYWGCETIAPSWIPGDGIDKYLKVQWGPYGCIPPRGWEGRGNCKYLFLNVTQPMDRGWIIGRMWGIRYWEPGTDKGGRIFIKKEKVEDPPQEAGPNKIINRPKIRTLPLPKSTPDLANVTKTQK